VALTKIFFSAVDSEASGSLRLIHPLMALKNKYGIEFEVLNSHDTKTQLRKANVVWLQCLVGPQQKKFIEHCKKQGIKVVIDYDDNFSDIPKNIQTRLGMSLDEITKNWHYYLQNADLITTPCQTLADQINKVTPTPVAVLPNLIQKATYEECRDYQPFADTSEIRILYSCSESHLEDFKFIVPVLSWIGKLYPNVKILTNGNLNFTYHDPNFKGKSLHISRTSYGSYYSLLKRYQPHIFLAPLLDNPYNKCRSDLKFQQASLLKCAFLGSDVGVYDNVKPTTGLLTSNYKITWVWNLRKLIKNLATTQKMGETAYQQLENNLLEDHIHLWHKALTGLPNA
jgi:hypothetical protein